MSSGCKAAVACVDVRAPVRASYRTLYKWPESDAEFVKSVTRGSGRSTVESRQWTPSRSAVVDSYSCRQMYLRSYTFSKKKESIPERARRCLDKVREKAALFHRQRDIGEKSSATKMRRRRKKKKGCVVAAKRLRDLSCSIFHRLLLCTASVDVEAGGQTAAKS